MKGAIPKNLAYLKPAFEGLRADLRAGLELDETRDNADIDYCLAQRVRGEKRVEAVKTLRADREALSDWLKSRPRHPGHYVLGYLSSVDARFVAKLQSAPSSAVTSKRRSRRRLSMDGPVGRKFKRFQGALMLLDDEKSPSAAVIAVPTSDTSVLDRVRALAEVGVPLTDVSFGRIRGKRYALEGKVIYLLTLESGAVELSIRGDKFDEDEIIALIPTMTLDDEDAA
jgi:hypothetical protein